MNLTRSVFASGLLGAVLSACAHAETTAASGSTPSRARADQSPPEPQPAFDPAREAGVLAQRTLELFDVPGMSVAVVANGELVMANGYGEIERGKGQPIDASTSFAIASNTKAFTATALGLLVADGKLKWDDRVVDHLPELTLWDPYVTKALTVRDLLSHRVGLATWAGDLMWLSSKLDRQAVLDRLRYLEPQSTLREGYGYCNLMYIVAGALIEHVTDQPWDAFIRTRLLDPLGMDNTATQLSALEGRVNVAKPHILVDGQWQTTPYLDLRTLGPAGSFHSSALEMSRWVRMQLADGQFEGQTIVPAEVIADTRQPHMWLRVSDPDLFEPARHFSGYGLGWFLADYRDQLLVTHSGGMPGMTSRVLMFPQADLGVVVLTSSESAASLALALAIADLYLAGPEAPRKDYIAALHDKATEAASKATATPEAPLAGQPPAALLGNWKNPLLGRAVIQREGDTFWFTATEHGGLRCRLYAGDPNDTTHVPCKWEDPNMKVSLFRLEQRGKKVRSLSFTVRPDFYDPLEYTFVR